MEETYQVIDHYLMIRLPEEIDHHHAAEISRRADCMILDNSVNHVVFDFEDTRFMDSSGIGVLAGRYRKISCFGGKVCDSRGQAYPTNFKHVGHCQACGNCGVGGKK